MSRNRKRARAALAVAAVASAGFSGAVGADDPRPHLGPPATNGAPNAPHVGAETLRPFSKGVHYWSLTEGFSRSQTKGDVYLTQLHVSRYFRDNLVVLFGGTIGYADAKRAEDGVFGGPEIGMRWHFAQKESWSTFLDGSVGGVFHEEAITPDSLRFNFDLQLGVGATYRLSKQTMLLAGLRSFHLSNARIQGKDNNLGYDAPLIYMGLLWSF
jgi:hypothetical protein